MYCSSFTSKGFHHAKFVAPFMLAANLAHAEPEVAIETSVTYHSEILENNLVVVTELPVDPRDTVVTGCSGDCPPDSEERLRSQLEIISTLRNKSKDHGVILMLKHFRKSFAEDLAVLYAKFIRDVVTDVRQRFNDDKEIVTAAAQYATGSGDDANAFIAKLEEAENRKTQRNSK
jgi:hypothetical protein